MPLKIVINKSLCSSSNADLRDVGVVGDKYERIKRMKSVRISGLIKASLEVTRGPLRRMLNSLGSDCTEAHCQ